MVSLLSPRARRVKGNVFRKSDLASSKRPRSESTFARPLAAIRVPRCSSPSSFKNPEYTSYRIRSACSSRPSKRNVPAILLCATSILSSDAPTRRSIDNWASRTDNSSSWCASAYKPFPSTFIAKPRSAFTSGRPTYVFQHTHPSAHRTTPWYSCSHRLHVVHRNHLVFKTKLFSSPSSSKIFACSAKHDTAPTP